MANWLGIYNAGTASVELGSTTVTLIGAGPIEQALRPGDRFGSHVGRPIRISAVGPGTVTLAYPWPGPSQVDGAYEIALTPYDSGYRQALQTLIDRYGGGGVAALAELIGDADQLPFFTGPGAMDVTELTPKGREIIASLDAAAAQLALGGSEVGVGVFAAEDAPAARTALGATTIGSAVFAAANAAAAQNALGLIPQENSSDTAAGRLLTVGAFGLGGTIVSRSGDVNVDLPTGFYYISSPVNGPGGPNSGNGWLQVIRLNAQYTLQQFWNLNGDHFSRLNNNATWQAWRRVTAETGSNSNGRYVKHSNGILECWHKVAGRSLAVNGVGTTSGVGFSPTLGWTFPAVFNPPPAFFPTVNGNLMWAGVSSANGASTTGVSYNIMGASPETRTVSEDLYAIGLAA